MKIVINSIHLKFKRGAVTASSHPKFINKMS